MNMQLEDKEKAPETDELDLVAFFVNLRSFVRLTIIPVVLMAVLGLLTGLVFVRKAPPVYTYKTVLQVGELDNQKMQALVESWNSMLEMNNQRQLSSILHCTTELLKQVSALKATSIPHPTPKKQNGLIITASVLDTSILPALQQALIAGFERNVFIADQLLQQKKQLNRLLNRINAEIDDLDSLKKVSRNNPGSSLLTKNLYGISTINSELVELTEKKIKYEDNLRNAVAVNVLLDFVESPSHEPNPYVKRLFLFFFAGLVIGFFIGAFRFVRVRYPMLFSSKQALVQK